MKESLAVGQFVVEFGRHLMHARETLADEPMGHALQHNARSQSPKPTRTSGNQKDKWQPFSARHSAIYGGFPDGVVEPGGRLTDRLILRAEHARCRGALEDSRAPGSCGDRLEDLSGDAARRC